MIKDGERFWNVYNHLARNWYEYEYGQVEEHERWYYLAMLLLERMAVSDREQVQIMGA